jgi:hypothetical protein
MAISHINTSYFLHIANSLRFFILLRDENSRCLTYHLVIVLLTVPEPSFVYTQGKKDISDMTLGKDNING